MHPSSQRPELSQQRSLAVEEREQGCLSCPFSVLDESEIHKKHLEVDKTCVRQGCGHL